MSLTIRNAPKAPKATKAAEVAMAGPVPRKITIRNAQKLHAMWRANGSKAAEKRFRDYMNNAGLTMKDLK